MTAELNSALLHSTLANIRMFLHRPDILTEEKHKQCLPTRSGVESKSPLSNDFNVVNCFFYFLENKSRFPKEKENKV